MIDSHLHASTHRYYEEHASDYAAATRHVELPRLWNLITDRLQQGAWILDLGCGAGRDLRFFAEHGYNTVGLDSSPKLVRIAHEYSGQPVILSRLENVPYRTDNFDAVWAIASLPHCDRNELPPLLLHIRDLLTPGGLFIASMREGRGDEVDHNGRFFALYDRDEWHGYLSTAGFQEIEVWRETEERSEGNAYRQVRWVVSLCRK